MNTDHTTFSPVNRYRDVTITDVVFYYNYIVLVFTSYGNTSYVGLTVAKFSRHYFPS